MRPVDIARVPEGHSEVSGAREHIEGLLVIIATEGGVAKGHAHTS